MHLKSSTYEFDRPLIEGIIIDRPNRFLMNVELNGKVTLCHCPPTGKIGNNIFSNTRCLVSKHVGTKRKHTYTVEAISTKKESVGKSTWVGINQTLINTYLGFLIKNGALQKICGEKQVAKREVKLGNSTFDFVIGNKIIEAKLFLNTIPGNENMPNAVTKYSSTRFLRQYKELIRLKTEGYSCHLLYCFIYDSDHLSSPILSHYTEDIIKIVNDGILKGINHWQVNLEISKTKICLKSYFPIT